MDKCPKCGSENISCFGSEVDNDGYRCDYECGDCGEHVVEWYAMEYTSTEWDDNDEFCENEDECPECGGEIEGWWGEPEGDYGYGYTGTCSKCETRIHQHYDLILDTVMSWTDDTVYFMR